MLYRYAAKTKDGLATKKGEVEAPSPKLARQLLQNNGLIVFSLVPARQSKSIKDAIYKIIGVTITDKVRFTSQLASMLVASLPLTKSLELLVTQTQNPNMVEIVKSALRDVESGKPLSSSLSKHPKVFSKSYISLVRAGEASGQLGVMLKKLGVSLEKQRQFRAKVRSAMVYPIIVISAMVGVFIIIMVIVVPKLTDMYHSLGVELPITTVIMVAISEFMTQYWYIILIIIAVLIYGIKVYKGTESGTYFFANLAFKLPVFGNLNKMSGIVDFSSTLALLMDAGVPIIEALNIVKDAAGNVLYRDSIVNFIDDVKKGFPISMAISKEPNFPSLVSQMAVTGEESGTLSDSFHRLAEYYEGEVDKIVKNLSTLIEPIIIVVLGVMVAVLMFAVITPIYQLITDL